MFVTETAIDRNSPPLIFAYRLSDAEHLISCANMPCNRQCGERNREDISMTHRKWPFSIRKPHSFWEVSQDTDGCAYGLSDRS